MQFNILKDNFEVKVPFKGKRGGNSLANRKSYDKSNV